MSGCPPGQPPTGAREKSPGCLSFTRELVWRGCMGGHGGCFSGRVTLENMELREKDRNWEDREEEERIASTTSCI